MVRHILHLLQVSSQILFCAHLERNQNKYKMVTEKFCYWSWKTLDGNPGNVFRNLSNTFITNAIMPHFSACLAC